MRQHGISGVSRRLAGCPHESKGVIHPKGRAAKDVSHPDRAEKRLDSGLPARGAL